MASMCWDCGRSPDKGPRLSDTKVYSETDLKNRVAPLLHKMDKIREAVASVKGTYKHPDELETAVFKAFEEISKVVDE
jgi:hypothetical protein